MRYLILLMLLIVSVFYLVKYTFEHSVNVIISWGEWGDITLTSTLFVMVVMGSFLVFYSLIALFRFLFGLRKRIRRYKQKKLSSHASLELTKGLLHFTEGHWAQSEKTLVDNVVYSETPLLNYLAAARAAHMQEAYNRRDDYLKKASELGDEAQTAVSFSKAEMQFTSGQLEQARATLIHLQEISPKHPSAIKLLAKIYYQQEDWDNLLSLLPELNKQALINEHDRNIYEANALKGIFMTLAQKQNKHKIKALWKKLPADIREKPEAILLYCNALSDVGDIKTSNKLLIASLDKKWDEKLIERYGLIDYDNLGAAIKRAEKWLEMHATSPQLLLTLARLNRQYQLWGKSKVYYNSSLNFSPAAAVYLELAELLEELSEVENAEVCYKLGLKYSIHKKGEILNLTQGKRADPSLSVAPDIDEEAFST